MLSRRTFETLGAGAWPRALASRARAAGKYAEARGLDTEWREPLTPDTWDERFCTLPANGTWHRAGIDVVALTRSDTKKDLSGKRRPGIRLYVTRPSARLCARQTDS